MKTVLRTASAALLWVLTVLGLYPVLHEGGHSLAAGIAGLRVHSISLFPTAAVTVDAAGVSGVRLFAVCAGGALFSTLATLCLRARGGALSVIRLMLMLVCVAAHAAALAAAAASLCGAILPDDMTPLLNGSAVTAVILLLYNAFWVVMLVVLIRREHLFCGFFSYLARYTNIH